MMEKTNNDFLHGYPPELDCAEFREIWEDWIKHRKEIRHPLTPTSVKLQFKKLQAMGLRSAVESLTRSIENGWIGIFEPPTQKPAGWRDAIEHEEQYG